MKWATAALIGLIVGLAVLAGSIAFNTDAYWLIILGILAFLLLVVRRPKL